MCSPERGSVYMYTRTQSHRNTLAVHFTVILLKSGNKRKNLWWFVVLLFQNNYCVYVSLSTYMYMYFTMKML